MDYPNTKVCTKCGVEKDFSEFGKRKNSSDGRDGHCKICVNARKKKWAAENRESVLASKKKWNDANKSVKHSWYLQNRDLTIERSKSWRELNPEKCAETKHNWRERNAEKVLVYKRNWEIKNPEKLAEKKNRRRARKAQNGVFQISEKFLKKLYISPCVSCFSTERIQADHVIPIYRGGVHSEGNLQPLCISCNTSKGAKLMTEWKRGNKN